MVSATERANTNHPAPLSLRQLSETSYDISSATAEKPLLQITIPHSGARIHQSTLEDLRKNCPNRAGLIAYALGEKPDKPENRSVVVVENTDPTKVRRVFIVGDHGEIQPDYLIFDLDPGCTEFHFFATPPGGQLTVSFNDSGELAARLNKLRQGR